jgi:hypothetical protein
MLTAILLWINNNRATRGWEPYLRRIAALDAIDEAVGRAVELGRPTYFTIGGSSFGGTWTSGGLAALSLVRYTAVDVASKGGKMWVGTNVLDHIPLADEAMRAGFTEGGAPENYVYETDIKWFPGQLAYIAGSQGLYARTPPGSQLLVGSFMAECLGMCEVARRGGAFMIGGTDYRPYMPYMVAICDYALIGEEIFVASAYVSDDNMIKSTIAAEDIVKWIIVGITIVAAIANLAGITQIVDILNI